MAKITVKENWRVEVTAHDRFYKFRPHTPEEEERFYRSELAGIEKEINRHVDSIGSTSITCDVRVVCSFCDSDWENPWDSGQPECCEKAIDEFNAKAAAAPSLETKP